MSSTRSIKQTVSPDSHVVLSPPTPMPIPNAAHKSPPPPPLPPPKHLPDLSAASDPGWQWANFLHHNASNSSLRQPDSSAFSASSVKTSRDEPASPFAYSRRTSSLSTATLDAMSDDGRLKGESDASPLRSNPGTELTGERDLRQRAIEQSSQSYDKQLLNRIGGPNTPKRQSISYSPSIAQENGSGRRSSSVWSITTERRHLSVDSTSTTRWPAGAVSPRSTSPWMEQDVFEGGRSATSTHNASLAFEYSGSQRGSYDYSVFVHNVPPPEDGQLSSLNIHDASPGSPKAGSKRRASSPPRERAERLSVSSIAGQQELPHRHSIQTIQTVPARTSPSSRFHPNHSSLSSVSSGPRHGSMGSSLGPCSIPSSATSYGSGGISPNQPSPAQDMDSLATNYAFATGSLGARHQRTASDHVAVIARKPSAEIVAHTCSASLPNTHGVYICECCPKKPIQFENEDDLRYHENEKQYTCAYCKKRFKNKNEAERHQNSVHLRRQSWCCAALTGVEAAFHPSSSTNYSADVCGYCGMEFPNPPAWEIRADHLSQAHKFGECNQSKKFYRADHFRQHLKHSHHGTSGKWTNVLENACVKYEAATPSAGGAPDMEKRINPVPNARKPPNTSTPPTLMITTTGLSGPAGSPPHPPAPPDTIKETPHNS